MIKIIFYCIDGMGLGHLMRGINIARELRKSISCEILFVVNSSFTEVLEKENLSYIIGGVDPYEAYSGKITHEAYRKANEEFLLNTVKKFTPQIIIFDLLIMPGVIAYCRQNNIFSVYILRELYDLTYLASFKEYLSYYNLVLLTCAQDRSFINSVTRSGFNKDSISYVGNIFREPTQDMIEEMRLKYQKKDDELLITVAAGGGGYQLETKNFFSYVARIADRISEDFQKSRGDFKKIRWLLMKGPLWRWKVNLSRHIEEYDYEINLPGLFSISDLVISGGGYNSLNEAIACRVPVIAYPFPRKMDSQIGRVLSYSSRGFLKTLDMDNIESAVQLFRTILKPGVLKKMKYSYDNFIHRNGARLAACLIIDSFLQYSKNKINLGILRLKLDSRGEFFIYEEARNFSDYRPIFLCGEIKNYDTLKNDYFCEDYLEVSHREFRLPIFSKKSLRRFSEIINRHNIKLLYAEFLADGVIFLPLAKKFNFPLAVNFRGYELSDKKVIFYLPKLLSSASKIIVKSNFQKEELAKKGIGEENAQVIFSGIDTDKIPFRFRNIRKDRLRLLSAGRLVEKKGFDVTLKFFKDIRQRYPLSRLTLIGEGLLKDEIKRCAGELGILNSLEIKELMPHGEFIKELFDYDIFILPCQTAASGDKEGIPNVLKEAMASGLPVISTYHAGIPELIEDGKNGFLVKEGDVQSIVDKFEWILKNKAKVLEIVLNARFYVEKYFNIKKTSKQVESLFNYLLIPKYARTILEVERGRKPISFRADLHLISGCNGKCIICDNWKRNVSSSFSTRDISMMLDDLKTFGVDYLRFHGQEPTLRKDLFSIMREAKNKGFRVGLKTNALAFDNNKKINSLNGIADDIYLSLDSSDKKIHTLLRVKKNSFSRNINLARGIKKINPGIRVYFNAAVTRLNYTSLVGLLDIASSLKIDRVSFVHLNTKNKRNIDKLKLTQEQFRDFYFSIWPRMLEKSRKLGIPVSVDPYFYSLVNLPLDQQIKKLKEGFYEFEEEISNFTKGLYGKKFYSRNICYGVLDHITIDWRGNVYPCCAMPRNEKFSVGNVHKKPFSDIWNEQRYAKYREDVLQGRCRFRNECSRNFAQTTNINRFFKTGKRNDNKINIIEEFLTQFRHSDYLSRYRLKMITYYAFSKCEFYRNKFAGYVRLDKNLDISKLPIVMRSEAKEAFLSGDIISNYFAEDYGIFRTSSCGRDAFLYARSLQTKRFSRMAVAFLNTGKWKINKPWLKLTALNCLDTVHPLGIKASSEITDDLEKGNAVIIPPSENFIDAPTADIKRIYRLIRNSNINLLHANPTYLKLLLYRFRKEGLRLNNHYAVNSTYETLLPSTKRLIKKYLDCEVNDQYGCSEIGPISFTCKQGSHHIFSDSVYVEIIPAEDLGRDDIGRTVVTDLKNKIMPFVKYFTGDFAYVTDKKECLCDLNTPLMGRIIGREDEMINYKGKIIFPLEIDNVFSDLDNILMYQVTFQARQFIIKIVPESKSKQVSKDAIRNRLIRYFDDKKCPIQIILVESILPSRRGKYRTVIVE